MQSTEAAASALSAAERCVESSSEVSARLAAVFMSASRRPNSIAAFRGQRDGEAGDESPCLQPCLLLFVLTYGTTTNILHSQPTISRLLCVPIETRREIQFGSGVQYLDNANSL